MSYAILIVDDDSAIRESVEEYLKIQNYKVKTASNAQEALDVLTLFHANIVITDIMMKGMDGLELTKKIKSKYIEILEDIETEDIYSKDEAIYIEIINFITAALHVDNDEVFNHRLLNLLDWFLIEYDEDDDISEVNNWISRIQNIAENAKQIEVREEAKDALENLDENISYNDNDSTLESQTLLSKISRFFK